MATDTLNSASPNPESKNPKKTLTLTTPNLNDEPINPSSEDPDSKPATVSSGDEEKETKIKGTAVVSPTGDGIIQRKLRRAERFGVPVQLSEEEKRNSRAERFGTGTGTVVGSEATKTAEEHKRKARAERFGLSVPTDDGEKKKARLARFGSDPKIDAVEEEKRKARAIRFSQPSTNNASQINHDGDSGQKTIIAGDATGGD